MSRSLPRQPINFPQLMRIRGLSDDWNVAKQDIGRAPPARKVQYELLHRLDTRLRRGDDEMRYMGNPKLLAMQAVLHDKLNGQKLSQKACLLKRTF